jgi:hypothetical protein
MKTKTTYPSILGFIKCLLTLVILFSCGSANAALYSNLFTDPSSYQVSCEDGGGQISNGKWKLNTKDSCIFTTPAKAVCGGAVNYTFEIKNTVNDKAYFQYCIGGGAWITDTMVNGYDVQNGNGRAIVVGSIVNPSPTISFRIICVIESNSGAWEIEGGKINFSYTACIPMPVEFGGLFAASNDNNVQLNWSTRSEKNSDFFSIERTLDGKNFETIGNVKAAGNASQNSNYQFTDSEPKAGYLYYRIKETDMNGIESYPSQIVAIYYEQGESKFDIYPNPMLDNRLNLSFGNDSEAGAEIILSILSMQGSLIATYTLTNSDDQNKYSLEIQENLIPGYYIFQAEKKGVKLLRKVLVQTSMAI